MAIKSILGSCLITLLIPLASIASPSGKYMPVRCEISQAGFKKCTVKFSYIGRMEYLQMTIRWPDGTVTNLKRPTGGSSAPWTDNFGIQWVESSFQPRGYPMTRDFRNIKTRAGFRITIPDWTYLLNSSALLFISFWMRWFQLQWWSLKGWDQRTLFSGESSHRPTLWRPAACFINPICALALPLNRVPTGAQGTQSIVIRICLQSLIRKNLGDLVDNGRLWLPHDFLP